MTGRVAADTLIRALDALDDGFAVIEVALVRRPADPARYRLQFVNRAAAAGASTDDLIGHDPRRLFAPAAGARLSTALAAVSSGGPPRTLRLRDARGDRTCEVTLAAAGEPDLVVASWRAPAAAARPPRARDDDPATAMRILLRTALDATSDAFAVYRVDRNGAGEVTGTRLMVMNQAGARPLPGDREDLVGQDLRDFFPEAVATGLWDALLRAVDGGEVQYHRVDVLDGTGTWQASFDNTIAPASDDLVVVTWRDVSETVRHARELAELHAAVAHSATHDDLTGLATRSLLLERTEAALRRAAADGSTVGLVFVDLDHFKGINDSLGHQAGDDLLRSVAARLESVARADDCVARFGGDEFVVLLAGMPPDWVPDAFLARVMERLRLPVDLGRKRVIPSASVGVALCPPVAADVETLLKHADLAMYESKRAGRGCVTVAAAADG
jgi:diguanylate cyclase (GGDEF)-like protein